MSEKRINEKIVELRVKKKMNQEDFAEIAHCSRQTISKWELGKSEPKIGELSEIAEHCDVDLCYFVGKKCSSEYPAITRPVVIKVSLAALVLLAALEVTFICGKFIHYGLMVGLTGMFTSFGFYMLDRTYGGKSRRTNIIYVLLGVLSAMVFACSLVTI